MPRPGLTAMPWVLTGCFPAGVCGMTGHGWIMPPGTARARRHDGTVRPLGFYRVATTRQLTASRE